MSDAEDNRKKPHLWRPVDPSIWNEGRPRGQRYKSVEKIWDVISGVGVLGAAMVIPFAFLISVLGIYSLVGPTLLGPSLLVLWGALTVAFIGIVEKTGYSRNFESWDFPLTPARLLAIPIGFAIIAGALYVLRFFHL